MNQIKTEGKYKAFVIAMCVFLSLQPYIVWSIKDYMNAILVIILFLTTFYYFKFLPNKKNVQMIIFFLLCNVYYFIGGTTYKGFSLIFLLPLFFLMLPDHIKCNVFEKFIQILAVVLFAGLITYTLRFIISLPSFTIPALNALKVDNYSVYLFDINISQFSLRYFSVFDEPGMVGTVCAMLISYKAIEIKTFQGKVILLSGLLSFSLAFYIMLFINLIYNFNRKHVIPFVLIFFTLSFLPEDNVFKSSIIERLQFADGQLSGENRTVKVFANNYEYFLEKGGSDLWFGRGVLADQYDDIDNAGGSSYKYLVYRHGIVGVILFIAFFTFVTLSIAPIKRGYFYLIVFILLAYQRINIFLLYNIALFVGGLVKIANNDVELKRIKSL